MLALIIINMHIKTEMRRYKGPKIKIGHVTLTMPLLRGFVFHRLGLAMITMPTKF